MPMIKPFGKSTCPYCFTRFYIGDCEIVSSTTGEVLRRAPAGGALLLSRVVIPSVSGAEYTQALATRRCPNCGELLPPNVEHVDGRIIGLVGGGASGKSHYIAALINLLERQAALNAVGCRYFAAANQDIEKRYDSDYYVPLFRRKEVIPPTSPLPSGEVNRPLIYEMVFDSPSIVGDGRKGVHLVLFDAAGEQIVDQAAAVLVNRYIQNASALILLVDPMNMPSVVENLPADLRPRNPPPPHEAFHVLNNVARIYRQEWGLKPSEQIDVPLAIALSKSDLLRYVPLGLGGQTPRFLEDAQYHGGYDVGEQLAVSQEVEEILRRIAEPGLFQAAAAFTNVSYHAVSATGQAPDPDTLTFSSVRSIRCLDPLLWVLWQIGAIKPANG